MVIMVHIGPFRQFDGGRASTPRIAEAGRSK
jgi:hypothetical protein